jgi:hypothetical protein
VVCIARWSLRRRQVGGAGQLIQSIYTAKHWFFPSSTSGLAVKSALPIFFLEMVRAIVLEHARAPGSTPGWCIVFCGVFGSSGAFLYAAVWNFWFLGVCLVSCETKRFGWGEVNTDTDANLANHYCHARSRALGRGRRTSFSSYLLELRRLVTCHYLD